MQKLKLIVDKKEDATQYLTAKKTESVKIAVIGCGYWGPKLVRNFASLSNTKVHALCDLDISNATRVATEYVPEVIIESDYRALLNDPQVSGIVIATQARTHYQIAKESLCAGKHVFVEKPLALTVNECQDLIQLAKQKNLVLMVGHVYRYNTDIQKIKEYIDSGILGDILYIHSRRLNLGKVQSDINAMWSFAPHDISILLYWLGENPTKVSTQGFSYLNKNIEDVVLLTMKFPCGVETHSHFSWLYPRKTREIIIVGSKKMLIYDDVAIQNKIQIHDKNALKIGSFSNQDENSYYDFQKKNRYSDVIIPNTPHHEPLKLECQHFIECIYSHIQPLTDGESGLRVVRILETAQRSLKNYAAPMEVKFCG